MRAFKAFLSVGLPLCSAAAFAMAVPPSAADEETAANKLIPQEQLVEVRVAAQTIREARIAGNSTPEEIAATGKYLTAADKALVAAIQARRALKVDEYKKQAAIVFANKDKACAILSGC